MEITAALRCQKKKKKILFFKTKSVTKEGLIVLRWILPESFACCFFNRTLAVFQSSSVLASLPVCCADNRRSGTTRAEILQNATSASHDSSFHSKCVPFDRCSGSFWRETRLFFPAVIVRGWMSAMAPSCRVVIAAFPASFSHL